MSDENFAYVSVCFDIGGGKYTYLYDGEVSVGDIAVVMTTRGRQAVFVTGVRYGTPDEAPYPFEKLKRIEEVLPYGSDGHRKMFEDYLLSAHFSLRPTRQNPFLYDD